MAGPTIAGSWEQAKVNTAKERHAEKLRRESALLPPPIVSTAQEIIFVAELQGKPIGPLTVLAGSGAPTITGGWVKLAKVQRFQRTSVTVPEGYDPLIMTVPIQFEAVAKTKERNHIELEIITLEEMAGRPKGEAIGEPPSVEVYTTTTSGVRTNLFPRKFSEDNELLWYITGITWDPNPYRDKGGERLRQAATVELTEILLSPGAKAFKEKTQKAIAAGRTHKFVTTKQWNCFRKVALQLGAAYHNPVLSGRWKVLTEYAPNAKLGNSPDKPLKVGTVIKIPPDFWVKVPR